VHFRIAPWTHHQLDPAQVQRMARLCFAMAWLLADPESP
jgi:hypothetical protein